MLFRLQHKLYSIKLINKKSKKLHTYNCHVYLFVYTHISLLKKVQTILQFDELGKHFDLTHFENKKDVQLRFSELFQMFKPICCYCKT